MQATTAAAFAGFGLVTSARKILALRTLVSGLDDWVAEVVSALPAILVHIHCSGGAAYGAGRHFVVLA